MKRNFKMSERPLWEVLAESNEEEDALIQDLEEGGDDEALLQVVQETTSVPRTNWQCSARSTRMFLFRYGTCGRLRQSIARCTQQVFWTCVRQKELFLQRQWLDHALVQGATPQPREHGRSGPCVCYNFIQSVAQCLQWFGTYRS